MYKFRINYFEEYEENYWTGFLLHNFSFQLVLEWWVSNVTPIQEIKSRIERAKEIELVCIADALYSLFDNIILQTYFCLYWINLIKYFIDNIHRFTVESSYFSFFFFISRFFVCVYPFHAAFEHLPITAISVFITIMVMGYYTIGTVSSDFSSFFVLLLYKYYFSLTSHLLFLATRRFFLIFLLFYRNH